MCIKSTVIVRKVDELGRIVILIKLRRTLSIGEKDVLEIFTERDAIILRAYKPLCHICSSLRYGFITLQDILELNILF